ncbi:MAG: 3-isopropylmalate dehydratase small subunit, partial [Actinobacteria bacterium]|nr:3-isopropylmalate dehydratase small subunit [Actinomycetota bacterium]
PEESAQKLLDAVRDDPNTVITVELTERTVTGPDVHETFEMDDFTRQRLLEGLDDISLTLTYENELEAFEKSRPSYLPRVQ